MIIATNKKLCLSIASSTKVNCRASPILDAICCCNLLRVMQNELNSTSRVTVANVCAHIIVTMLISIAYLLLRISDQSTLKCQKMFLLHLSCFGKLIHLPIIIKAKSLSLSPPAFCFALKLRLCPDQRQLQTHSATSRILTSKRSVNSKLLKLLLALRRQRNS